MLCVYCCKIRYRLILLNVATVILLFNSKQGHPLNFFLSKTLPTTHIQFMSEELGMHLD